MTIDFPTTEAAKFEATVDRLFNQGKSVMLHDMANRFLQLTRANFGIAGVDRPAAWDALSAAYARKVGRSYATLIVSGRLRDAIQVGGFEGDSVTVEVDNSNVPYALVHQWGGTHMPARPYFPVNRSGDVMPYTKEQVIQAAQQALAHFLS